MLLLIIYLMITVVVPFYREKKIAENVVLIADSLKGLGAYEVILVSDGEMSESKQLLKSVLKKSLKIKLIGYEKNQGRGYALKFGLSKAKAQMVAYIDADLDVNPEYLPKLFKLLKTHPVVIGSKYHPQSIITTTFYRRMAGRLFNLWVRLVLSSKASDHQIGFKGFHSVALRQVLPKTKDKRWMFDVELLYYLQQAGWPIYEMPVKLKYGFGKVRGSFIKDFLKMCYYVLLIRNRS